MNDLPQLRFHQVTEEKILAELVPGNYRISETGDILDIMADARYNGSGSLIIHASSLPEGFFDLKTKIAGEILQKFSNYRMELAIIGDFLKPSSKSLADFIRESNRMGTVMFVDSLDQALERMKK